MDFNQALAAIEKQRPDRALGFHEARLVLLKDKLCKVWSDQAREAAAAARRMASHHNHMAGKHSPYTGMLVNWASKKPITQATSPDHLMAWRAHRNAADHYTAAADHFEQGNMWMGNRYVKEARDEADRGETVSRRISRQEFNQIMTAPFRRRSLH